MKESPLTCPPHAPAGLKYNRGFETRFWVRPDTASFRRLFAVHFALMFDGVHASAFAVTGYLGAFPFNWHDPQHACQLLVANRTGRHSRQLLGSLLRDGSGEWLLCNQPDSAAAMSCEDAKYVAQRCEHDRQIKGLPGVYFISNGRGAVKIGKSGNCINARFVSLQIANPDTLRVVAVIADPSPDALEAAIHSGLAAKRLRGEWFAMHDDEAIALAKQHGGRAVTIISC
jgi:hypothetical protein